MKVFISWSGELSHAVALELRGWIPKVIQAVDPWVSSDDINKGARWFAEVSRELEQANFGIICVTRENYERPWLLFETGALSKQVSESLVTPFLIDLTPGELDGPLSHFQMTKPVEDDVLKMLNDLNKELGDRGLDSAVLNEVFEKWWPDLEKGISKAKKDHVIEGSTVVKRSQEEMLGEILDLTRALSRSSAQYHRNTTEWIQKINETTPFLYSRTSKGIFRAPTELLGVSEAPDKLEDESESKSTDLYVSGSNTTITALPSSDDTE